MSGFQAVNTTTLAVPERPAGRLGEDTTPTTPRPNKFFVTDRPSEDPTAKTPTRDSFAGLVGQRPLPSAPYTSSQDMHGTTSENEGLSRENSQQSVKSEGQDVDMAIEDDDHDGSDNESMNSDGNRPSKKKKGQRFFCTDFPPCQLSFTRSEHLARHIRKHTGERPFQCHCSRRFSRLDNLRQHAQTVHVNEDIPTDSLAATGTRFQRQIRTDRVRPPINRSRASTIGSQTGHTHSRGHSRNLSASSIASTTSSISVNPRDDLRRRPAPLAMANDTAARARLSLDTFNPPHMGSPGPQYHNYGNQSPSGVGTPSSSTFSASGSPRIPQGLQSPISTVPRTLTWGSRTPGRRLSVPSGANPFQGPLGSNNFPASYISPLPSSSSSTFSGNESLFSSPTSSVFSESRREYIPPDDWRRRTWHPSTYTSLGPRPATSGLSYYQTPDAPQPTFSTQPAASQTTRLPGIESFDHAPPPPSLVRRQPSPMQIDDPNQRPAPSGPPESFARTARERVHHKSWDMSIQNVFTKLEIASPNPPRETEPWGSQFAPAQSYLANGRPTTAPNPSYYSQQLNNAGPSQPQPSARAQERPNEPVTPRKNKRDAWYNGPLPLTQQAQQATAPVSQLSFNAHRTSPEDSSSSEGVHTPSTSSLAEFHPAIVHSNGYIEAHPPGVLPVDEQQKVVSPQMHQPIVERSTNPSQAYPTAGPQNSQNSFQPGYEGRLMLGQPQSIGGAEDMTRLQALVAVATGEQQGDGPSGR